MPPTIAATGKKRKRFEPVEKDISTKLTGKLHHCLKEVRKCAKKAKAFETQRLVKKLKDLRKLGRKEQSASDDINDIETQLELLKKTDPDRIALLALSSKIRKDKKLSAHESLTSVLSSAAFSILNEDAPGRHSKVESRLLSSKIIAMEVSSTINGLRMIVEPDLVSKLKISNTKDRDDIDGTDGEEYADKVVSDRDSQVLGGLGDSVEQMVVDEADDLVSDDGWESGSIDGGDVIQYNSGDESSAHSEGDEHAAPPLKRSKRQSSQSIPSPSKPSTSTATSTFLPSLSVGYIKGNSDSDYESEDEKAPGGKKNRRGQRARQAIWEKKFGKNAKHVKKQREEEAAAVTARFLGKRQDHGWKGRGRDDSTKFSQNTSKQSKDKIAADDKPTHPSWEAKRKLKEKESARILPSQGKKIVFT